MIKQLKKDNLADWLSKTGEEQRVIVPQRVDSRVSFQRFEREKEVILNELPFMPAKSVLLPQTEDLIKFKSTKTNSDVKKSEFTITSVEDSPKTLLFGVLPCDLKGIRVIEYAFSHGYNDPYYLNRRQKTVLVAYLGHAPHEACFCGVFDDPLSTDGADIVLVDDGEIFYLQALTDKGREFLSTSGLEDTAQEDRIEQLKTELSDKLKAEFDIQGIENKLDGIFESSIWEELTAKCLGCGTCTYLCPTCYCFDIFDEKCGGNCGKRTRTWDTCQSRRFTLEASGHNPRLKQSQRYRNRVYHKFKILKDETGHYGCSGCGRCVIHCPVYMDIREVIKRICQ